MPRSEVTGPLTQGSWRMRTSCVAPSTWRPARRRSRSWTPETWRSSDFQSDRPVTEPSSPVTSLSRRTRGTKSARNAVSAGRSYTRSCVTGGRPRPGIPAVAAPWPYRAVSLGPPPVSLVKSTQKNAVTWLLREKRTPPCANPPYLAATPSRGPGERVGTPEVLHEVIRTRIRPRAGGDFRRSVWHEKARLSRLCWPTRGFGTLAYVWYCYLITKAPQASINAQRLSKKSVLK